MRLRKIIKVISGYLRLQTLRHKDAEIRAPEFSHLSPAWVRHGAGKIKIKKLGTSRGDIFT
jgi:hypothetical protein